MLYQNSFFQSFQNPFNFLKIVQILIIHGYGVEEPSCELTKADFIKMWIQVIIMINFSVYLFCQRLGAARAPLFSVPSVWTILLGHPGYQLAILNKNVKIACFLKPYKKLRWWGKLLSLLPSKAAITLESRFAQCEILRCNISQLTVNDGVDDKTVCFDSE